MQLLSEVWSVFVGRVTTGDLRLVCLILTDREQESAGNRAIINKGNWDRPVSRPAMRQAAGHIGSSTAGDVAGVGRTWVSVTTLRPATKHQADSVGVLQIMYARRRPATRCGPPGCRRRQGTGGRRTGCEPIAGARGRGVVSAEPYAPSVGFPEPVRARAANAASWAGPAGAARRGATATRRSAVALARSPFRARAAHGRRSGRDRNVSTGLGVHDRG